MYAVALLMGLTGGFHCLGMCGPLVAGAIRYSPSKYSQLIYAAGRIFTYGMLGALVGGIGEIIRLTKYQSILSLSLGSLLLLIGLGAVKSVHIPVISKAVYRLIVLLKSTFGRLLSKKGRATTFVLGALNGLLPCGLTYLAMAYCITLSYAKEGFLFMIIFGLGTLPVMVGSFWVIGRLWSHFKINYHKINTVLLIASGILMIGRALFLHVRDATYSNNYFLGGETLCW